MNKSYRVVWNESAGTYTAVQETAKGRKKSKSVAIAVAAAAVALLSGHASAYVAGAGASAGSTYGTSTSIGDGATGTSSIRFAWTGFFTPAGQTSGMNGIYFSSTAIGANANATDSGGTAIGDSAYTAGGDSTAVGAGSNAANASTAIGAGSQALGKFSNAFGINSWAIGTRSTAFGVDAASYGDNSMAVGNGSRAIDQGSLAIGNGAVADGNTAATSSNVAAVAIGQGTNAKGDGAAAIGTSAVAAGDQTAAIGRNAKAQAAQATAIGANTTASAAKATALGAGATASGNSSFAAGQGASATNFSSLALGTGATTTGQDATAIGSNSSATGLASVSIGKQSSSSSTNSVAIGTEATTVQGNSTAIGYQAQADAGAPSGVWSATAVGTHAVATGDGAAALGDSAKATADKATAIGRAATTTVAGGVAIGAGATASRAGMNGAKELFSGTAVASTMGAVSVGSVGSERQITNVAGGTQDTDAVNVRQLKSSNQQIVNVIGGTTTIDATTGAIKGPFITLNGNTYNTVGDAITNVNTIANKGWNVTTAATGTGKATGTSVANVAPGATATYTAGNNIAITQNGTGITIATSDTPTFSSVTTNNLTVNNNTTMGGSLTVNGPTNLNGGTTISKNLTVNAGTTVDMGGNKIVNVARGQADGDAVNMSQLNETNNNVTNLGNTVNNFAGDQSVNNTTLNGRGIRYVRTNDTGLTVDDSYAQGQGSTAVGYKAKATGKNALALGRDTQAGKDDSVALGSNAVANRDGMNGAAEYFSSTAVASTMGAVSVGDAGKERQITNVAGGTQDTDAVNVRQLKSSNQQIVNVIGGTTNIDASTGAIKGPFITLGGNTYNTVGDAITNVYGTASKGWDISAQGANSSNVAPGGKVDLNNSDGNIVVSKKANSNDVTFDLAKDLTIGNSVTIGDTYIDGTSVNTTNVNTTNLTVKGDTHLGDHFSVVNNEAYYDGPITENTHIVNKQYVDNSINTLDQNAVKYDKNPDGTVNYNSVTMGGDKYNSVTKTGGTKITNVARGVDDSDAVNMSQLNETNNNVTNVTNAVNNFAGDQTTEYTTKNGRGIRYVRTNDTGTEGVDDAYAEGQGSTAVGYKAKAKGKNALALGRNAEADNDNSVALGADSTTDEAVGTANTTIAGTTYNFKGISPVGTVSVGSAGAERTIINVAAGRLSATSTDAVNGSQLYATNQAVEQNATNINILDQGAVKYDKNEDGTVNYNSVTLNKGGSSTTITNVAAGEISANSTDAVNGSQLYETNQRVDNIDQRVTNIDNTVNSINNGGGIRYFRHNVSDDSMPDASANGYASVAVGSGATTTEAATNSVAMGMNAKVDAANGLALGSGSTVTVANSVALGAGSVATTAATPVSNATIGNMTYGGFAGSAPTGVVSVGAQGAERQITNVAAGRITADSTDAVNGSQLYSVADGLNKKIDNSVSYDTTNVDGSSKTNVHNDITLKGDGGTQIHNLADGTAPNDAATVGQLNNAVAGINQQMQGLGDRIETVNKDANAGTAGAMAMAGMPQATMPGKSMVAAGVAAYQGEAALAMGVSKLSDDGRWIVKLSGTANTRGKVGVAGGVGFHW